MRSGVVRSAAVTAVVLAVAAATMTEAYNAIAEAGRSEPDRTNIRSQKESSNATNKR